MSSIDDAMLSEIITVEAGISRFRSTSTTGKTIYQFSVTFPSKNASAEDVRARRNTYTDTFLGQVKEKIEQGSGISCITGTILKDPYAELNEAILIYFKV